MMKKLFSLLSLGISLCLAPAAFCQVKDIGQSFKKRGFIQNIDYAEKVMLVNFIDANEIVNEVMMVKNTQFSRETKDKLLFTDLKQSDEIWVEGEQFTVDRYSEAIKITLVDQSIKSINDGRIDFISGDVACVDGNKVKLKPGKKISGEKKSGYENKTFSAITELKLGDIASCRGKLNKEGCFIADEFTIAPENNPVSDIIVDSIDAVYHQKFYPVWADKNKRAKFLNTDIPGIGKVYNDQGIQDYVYALGTKLVPVQIQDKINFVFVVVDNPGFNANIRANGLCYVYSGLLKSIENEAQLAAIIGHEIGHVIYKHVSNEAKERAKAAEKKGLSSDGSKIANNVINKVGDVFKGNDKKEKEAEKNALKSTSKAIGEASYNLTDRQLSTYSVDAETQADRIGLSIMVFAGYDPREAPRVWKNVYAKYGQESPPPKPPSVSKKVREDLTKDNSKDNESVKTTAIKTGGEVLTALIKWKAADYKTKSYKTHPDHINRFEKLNRLVSLYWSDEQFLNTAKTETDNYSLVLSKAFKKK